MTSLTGRDADVARMREALPDARGHLLCVTGPQGVGKTTLVRHVLGEDEALVHTHLYVDVHHVCTLEELGWVVLAQLEPEPLTSGVEIQAAQESDASSRLSRRLRHDKRLLVLDHLSEAFVKDLNGLGEFLGAGEEDFAGCVCITHEHVDLSCGEVRLEHIEPLSTKASHDVIRAELSTARYQTLTSQSESREALDEIVSWCMGRPLWLVLWSRRLELMSPVDLLESLAQGRAWGAHDDPHVVLMEGLLTSLPKPAWRTWVQCSIFEGLFPVMMCEQMYGSEAILEPLETLRSHGILEVIDTPEEVMCRIHPMFRGHILGGLHDEDTAQVFREACVTHGAYFASRAADCVALARGAFDHAELGWLARYHRDVEAALGRAAGGEERALEQALALVALRRGDWSRAFEVSAKWKLEGEDEEVAQGWSALIWLDVLGSSDEPRRGLDFAIAWFEVQDQHTSRSGEDATLTLAMLVRAAEIASQLERASMIEPLLERGLKLSMGPAHRVERGRLLLVSALTNIYARDWFTAQAMCQEAAHLFEVAAHVRFMGKAAYHLGHIYKNLWKGEESLEAYDRAIVCARASQDMHGLAQVYRELAWLWLDRGDLERAELHVVHMEELAAIHAMSWQRGVLCMLRGQVSMQRGVFEDALVELEAARWHLASSQQQYLLAATIYFEFLCYWACGQIERARVYMHLGDGMSTQITSVMALTCYDCARIVVSIEDGELDEADAILKQSRVRHEESRSTSWLGSLLDVHAFYLSLTRYQALPKRSTRKAKAMAVELAQQGVALQARQERGGLVTDFNAEVRICWALIAARIPQTIQGQIDLGMIDPSGEALIVNRAQQTFRAPHSSTWVNMSRREVPFRLLCVLVDQRVQAPGQPIDASELFEKVWPDESILQESAQNRLYVTMASLRKEGLRSFISSVSGGYLLNAQMRLIEV